MNTGTKQEPPVFTATRDQSSTFRSASEPLAVPSGASRNRSDVFLGDAERTLTMGGALAAGLHVAEWGGSYDLIRCYGRTPDEARARLLAVVAAEVWLIDPSGTAVKADGTRPTPLNDESAPAPSRS